MAKRKPLSKKTRFEIFKRDSFTCQYCGAVAPDVLLHIDHIIPVASGGTNEFLNLITSCQACNAGKGKRELGDKTVVTQQKQQLDELNERRVQLEMLVNWRNGLASIEEDKLSLIEKAIEEKSQFSVNEHGRRNIRKWLTQFEFDEILNAIDTAFLQYLKWEDERKATSESWNRAFDAIPGIIRVRRSSAEKPYLKELLYIRGILRNRLNYLNERDCLDLLEQAVEAGATIDSLKKFSKRVRSWSQFQNEIYDFLTDEKP